MRTSVPEVAKAAIRDYMLERTRPVLANELSDYKTPYMMKKGAHKRLLENVARNPFEEKLVDKALNRRPDLVRWDAHFNTTRI